MANPYTSVSISGYNTNPPSDDGASTSTNEVEWAKHINKIGDPVKTLGETINTNVSTAFDKIFLNNISAHSANYTVQVSDQGKLLSCTSTITITLLAAASAGSNFAIGIRNAGTGVITIDGNGAETINGSATITLNENDWIIICSNASNWQGFHYDFVTSRGALVRSSSAKTISNSIATALDFDTEDYDTDNIHDTVTNNSRLTVPTGITKVRLSGNVVFDPSTTGRRNVRIWKNGANFAGMGYQSTDAHSVSVDLFLNVISAIVEVTGGDYFQLVVQQVSGGNLDVGTDANITWFCMEIIE